MCRSKTKLDRRLATFCSAVLYGWPREVQRKNAFTIFIFFYSIYQLRARVVRYYAFPRPTNVTPCKGEIKIKTRVNIEIWKLHSERGIIVMSKWLLIIISAVGRVVWYWPFTRYFRFKTMTTFCVIRRVYLIFSSIFLYKNYT